MSTRHDGTFFVINLRRWMEKGEEEDNLRESRHKTWGVFVCIKWEYHPGYLNPQRLDVFRNCDEYAGWWKGLASKNSRREVVWEQGEEETAAGRRTTSIRNRETFDEFRWVSGSGNSSRNFSSFIILQLIADANHLPGFDGLKTKPRPCWSSLFPQCTDSSSLVLRSCVSELIKNVS